MTLRSPKRALWIFLLCAAFCAFSANAIGVPSPLVCSLSSFSPSVCELAETSVIIDNTSHKAAREAVDLEVVDADLADLVIFGAFADLVALGLRERRL